jgi:hypothetical protein
MWQADEKNACEVLGGKHNGDFPLRFLGKKIL